MPRIHQHCPNCHKRQGHIAGCLRIRKLDRDPDVRRTCGICRGPIYTDEIESDTRCPDCLAALRGAHEAALNKHYVEPLPELREKRIQAHMARVALAMGK